MRSCGKDGKDKSYLIRYHVVNPCKSKVETQLQKVLNLEVHNGTIAGGLFIKKTKHLKNRNPFYVPQTWHGSRGAPPPSWQFRFVTGHQPGATPKFQTVRVLTHHWPILGNPAIPSASRAY